MIFTHKKLNVYRISHVILLQNKQSSNMMGLIVGEIIHIEFCLYKNRTN